MAITNQDIHATADQIVADGGNPTLSAVRKALGGGSYTTISDAMHEWKSKNKAKTAAAPIKEPAPASVSEKLNVFGSDLWGMALEMANSRLQSEREVLEQVRQELEQTQKEAIDLADQLSSELDFSQATIERQMQEITKFEAEAAAMVNDIELERKEREKAERKAETATAVLAETHQQIKALNVQINELKNENREISKKLDKSYREAVGIKSELDLTVERLNTSKIELTRDTARHKLESEKAALALIEKDELIKSLASKLEVAQIKASDSAQEAQGLKGKIEAMEKQGELYHAYIGAIKKLDEAA